MTFRQLLELADEGYRDAPPPPGHKYADYKPDPERAILSLLHHVDAEGNELPDGPGGDTLALFILRELKDTFDSKATDEQQLQTAQEALEFANEQVEGAATSLELALLRLRNGDPYHAGN